MRGIEQSRVKNQKVSKSSKKQSASQAASTSNKKQTKMAKSLRSKIKRKFRAEHCKLVGLPHLAKQEQKIQEQLKKAIQSQVEGAGVLGLKKLMGTANAPVAAIATITTTEVNNALEASMTDTEVNLMNMDEDVAMKKEDKKAKKEKKLTKKKRGKNFVHLYTLRKKGL